jgi:hypothetical protein
MEKQHRDYAHIKGWGVDANDDNEPTYPIKDYTGDDHDRLNWARPELQEQKEEVLQSNERPYMTAVFGTSLPPSGLSGILRRKAFKYSESSYGHWLPLLLADRVNVIEGIVDDIKHGHVPNIFGERGWKAAWKYNRKGMIIKSVACLAIACAVIVLRTRKRKHKIRIL